LIEEDPARPGPAEASIVGGPKVWQLVAHWKVNNRNDHIVAAEYDLPLATVQIALWYYAAHSQEIQARIRKNAVRDQAIMELSREAQEMGMYD
jgi:hypothetical protein